MWREIAEALAGSTIQVLYNGGKEFVTELRWTRRCMDHLAQLAQ